MLSGLSLALGGWCRGAGGGSDVGKEEGASSSS